MFWAFLKTETDGILMTTESVLGLFLNRKVESIVGVFDLSIASTVRIAKVVRYWII